MSIAEKFEVIADEVYEKGKKDEYDRFWDAYQYAENGVPKRTNYENGFRGSMGWTKDNFYPKYDIKPVGNANYLFYAWEYADRHTMDLSARLKECGVVLDTSRATSLQCAFSYVRLAIIPPIDVTGLTNNSSLLFADSSRVKIIEKLIIAETTPINSNWFRNDKGLETITIEGTIGQNNFNVSACIKLSGASIVSIIEALSTTTSGLTVTLSQTAVNNMVFPITSTRTDAEGNEYTTTYNSWVDLAGDGTEGSPNVGIRPNWKIALL